MSALQLFDALSPAIEDALRASIRRFGVIVPVVKDQHGRIVDGHHRSRIAGELGVDFAVQQVTVASEDEAREIARTLNSDRRHLTEEQRRPVVTELRQQGHSYRAIAGALGTSLGTVQRDLATVSPDTVPDRITGLDGKSRPATRPVTPEADDVSTTDAIDDVPLWDEPTPAPADMPARQEIADLIASRLDQVVEAQAKPATPATPDQARERDYQASSEAWSRNLAKCVYLLAGFSNLNGFVEKALKEWQPGQDIYPTKTTAERMRAAAAYLNAIAERWPA